jgi:hypothetical protein
MVVIDIMNASDLTDVVGSAWLTSTNEAINPIINVTVLNHLNGVQWGVVCIFVYIAAVVFHEFGHWFALYMLKKEPHTSLYTDHGRIKLATIPQILTENAQQRSIVIVSGILAGFVAIGIGALIHPYVWLLAIPYSTGFVGDIKKLAVAIKEMQHGR